jgi:prepilin-type processing-associated H-X9-DG protein
LKQIGLAFAQYTQDYDERYPAGNYFWCYYDAPGGSTPSNPSGYANCADFGVSFYTDSNGLLLQWYNRIFPYVKSIQIFDCPSNNFMPRQKMLNGGWDIQGNGGNSYGWNTDNNNVFPFAPLNSKPGIMLSQVPDPAGTLLVTEIGANAAGTGPSGTNPWKVWGKPDGAGQVCAPGDYHFGGANVLFADGHVKWKLKSDMTYATTPDGIWTLKAGD